MNCIKICTNRQLYEGGDSVFGAVYAKIVTPTCATGILLRVLGYERYHCRCLCDDEPDRVIQDSKEHIVAQEEVIYQRREPLSLGKYTIPFKVYLPQGLPGSFHLSSTSGPEWEGVVQYKLQAEFISIHNARISSQCQLSDPEQIIFVVETAKFEEGTTTTELNVEMKKGLTQQKCKLHIKACLDRPLYTEGDIMKLSIGFSHSGFKPVINRISIKVMRSFRINLKEDRFLDKPPSSPLMRAIRNLARGGGVGLQYQDPTNMYLAAPNESEVTTGVPRFLHPEHGPTTLWERSLIESEGINLIRGVTGLHIPLRSNLAGKPLTPTVNGYFIKSEYYINLEIKVNDHKKTLAIPIPHVRCKHQYVPATEPAWVDDGDCRLILSQHKFSVEPHAISDRNMNNLPRTWNKIQETVLVVY